MRHLAISFLLGFGLLCGTGCGEPEAEDGPTNDASHKQHDAGSSDDATGEDFAEFAGGRQAATVDGAYYLRYTPTPDPIPVSELFSVEVEVYESSEMSTAVSGADLSVSAEMPTHGHGMNTEPQVSDNGDGTYTIEGMKFHMPSDPQNPWTMELTVDRDGATDVAKFKVITGEK